MRPGGLRTSVRGFTLVETLTVVLIVGILAAAAVWGLVGAASWSKDSAAANQLRDVATVVLARQQLDRAPTFTPDLVARALDGTDGGPAWNVLGPGDVPREAMDLSVAFDHGEGLPTSGGGTRALILARTAAGKGAVIIVRATTPSTTSLANLTTSCLLPSAEHTAHDLLAAATEPGACAGLPGYQAPKT